MKSLNLYRPRRAAGSRRNRFLLIAVLSSLVFIVWALIGSGSAGAEHYSPSDSVALTIGTVSINADSVQDCDSVRVRWWRLSGGWTLVGTEKLTSSIEEGFYAVKVKASDASGRTGNYIAKAIAYKFDGSYTDVKTWSWTVVESFDSLTNSITDANKANFRTDVSGLLEKADSALYMRTDWDNLKNQNASVNLGQTRLAYVDTVDSLKHPGFEPTDTSRIKAMNENNQWGASFVWNHPVRTLTSGAGTGANSVVIRCKDSSDSSAVAFAQIQVLDSTESSTVGLLTSDSQGRGFFALDQGAYWVRLYKPGWQFVVPEALMVTGDEDKTYYAQAFDPGMPPQASLCRVYGWIHDINDQPMVGTKIEAGIPTVPLRYQNLLISPYQKSTVTDTEGYWYLDIYPNFLLSPADTRYIFHVFGPSGTILRLEADVPDVTSWELQW